MLRLITTQEQRNALQRDQEVRNGVTKQWGTIVAWGGGFNRHRFCVRVPGMLTWWAASVIDCLRHQNDEPPA